MKKQKIKKFIKKNFYSVLIFFTLSGTVLGVYTSFLISSQSSTEKGSNDSVISFTGSVGNEGYYINDEDNSAIIGNYFKGYYYDTLFGFFKLDWSSNEYENVRITGSTDMCTTGYGYKLGGKAYSDISGYIDFNYNLSTFVYYCLDDGQLHGTAYGKYIGFQDFEGINISVVNNIVDLTEKVSNDIFINDTSNIENKTTVGSEVINNLGGDLIQIDDRLESIFYIVK